MQKKKHDGAVWKPLPKEYLEDWKYLNKKSNEISGVAILVCFCVSLIIVIPILILFLIRLFQYGVISAWYMAGDYVLMSLVPTVFFMLCYLAIVFYNWLQKFDYSEEYEYIEAKFRKVDEKNSYDSHRRYKGSSYDCEIITASGEIYECFCSGGIWDLCNTHPYPGGKVYAIRSVGNDGIVDNILPRDLSFCREQYDKRVLMVGKRK